MNRDRIDIDSDFSWAHGVQPRSLMEPLIDFYETAGPTLFAERLNEMIKSPTAPLPKSHSASNEANRDSIESDRDYSINDAERVPEVKAERQDGDGLLPCPCCETLAQDVDADEREFIVEALQRLATPPVRGDREELRKLVDVVWNEATESTAVPATKWADRLIDKVFSLPVQPGAGEREATIRECARIAKFGAKECADVGDTDWQKGFRYAAHATALEIENKILALSRQPQQSSK